MAAVATPPRPFTIEVETPRRRGNRTRRNTHRPACVDIPLYRVSIESHGKLAAHHEKYDAASGDARIAIDVCNDHESQTANEPLLQEQVPPMPSLPQAILEPIFDTQLWQQMQRQLDALRERVAELEDAAACPEWERKVTATRIKYAGNAPSENDIMIRADVTLRRGAVCRGGRCGRGGRGGRGRGHAELTPKATAPTPPIEPDVSNLALGPEYARAARLRASIDMEAHATATAERDDDHRAASMPISVTPIPARNSTLALLPPRKHIRHWGDYSSDESSDHDEINRKPSFFITMTCNPKYCSKYVSKETRAPSLQDNADATDLNATQCTSDDDMPCMY